MMIFALEEFYLLPYSQDYFLSDGFIFTTQFCD